MKTEMAGLTDIMIITADRWKAKRDNHVRMMLTGQVFSVMGNVADDAQTAAIIKSADLYLYKKRWEATG